MRTMAITNIFNLRAGKFLFMLLGGLLYSSLAWSEELFDADGFFIVRVPSSRAAGLVNSGTRPEEALLQTAYAGGETLRYRVSWLGITAGGMVMQGRKSADSQENLSP